MDDLAETQSEDLLAHPVGAELAGDVAALARLRHRLDAELGRRIHAAQQLDACPTTPRSLLRQAGWDDVAASRMVSAARTAATHAELRRSWANGQISVEQIHTLECGARKLPADRRGEVVDAITPLLPALERAELRAFLQRLADSLRDQPDGDSREQSDWDARFLSLTSSAGMVHLTGLLPALEGETLAATLHSLAEANRAAGDGRTKGQRFADALVHLVANNHAADLIPTQKGTATAATITIPLAEIDRIADRRAKSRLPIPQAESGARISLAAMVALVNQHRATTATITGSVNGDSCAGAPLTLGDAAAAFALCTGNLTGAITTPVVSTSAQSPFGRQVSDALSDSRLQPLALGRSVRLADAHQRKALALRDRTCVMPGCDVPGSHCDTHHVREWAVGGDTDLSNLALLCWTHHREVDLNRWRLTRNPDPGSTHWLVERTPRSSWRPRR